MVNTLGVPVIYFYGGSRKWIRYIDGLRFYVLFNGISVISGRWIRKKHGPLGWFKSIHMRLNNKRVEGAKI